jgi:hypothetical protein
MKIVMTVVEIVIAAAVISAQLLVIRFERDALWAALGVCAAAGLALLIIHRTLAARAESKPPLRIIMTSGAALLFFPAMMFLAYAFTLFYMFGTAPIALAAAAAAAGTLATSRGSVALPVLCLIPAVWLMSFYVNMPALLPEIATALISVAALATIKIRFRLPAAARAALFGSYALVLYGGFWYLSPLTIFSARTPGDAVAKHIAPLERMADSASFPRGFYEVTESCDGSILFLSNVFSSPGALAWNRNSGETSELDWIDGAAEQLAIDCETNSAIVGEYNTGRMMRVAGGSLSGARRILRAKIYKPCRMAHFPGSNLFYINSDLATFPWLVMDASGNILHKIAMGNIEEILPLEDDSFIAVSDGMVIRSRFDAAEGRLLTVAKKPLPGVGRRFGPLYQHLAFDRLRGNLYVSDFNTGYIFRVRLSDLRVKKIGEYGRGLRHMTSDPNRGLLAVGNYITGNIMLLNGNDGSVVYSKNIGSRLRGVSLSRDGERIYAVSRAGVFELSIEKAVASAP